MYTHPERFDPEAGMQEIIDLTGGLKLSRTEVYMEAQEMEGLNEMMNEDDLDSEEEEFFFKAPGMGLPQSTLRSVNDVTEGITQELPMGDS